MHVVDDIDAADKCDFGVYHHDLGMQPAQPFAAQRPRRYVGTEFQDLHTRLAHLLQKFVA
jgi:hypothetical protein